MQNSFAFRVMLMSFGINDDWRVKLQKILLWQLNMLIRQNGGYNSVKYSQATCDNDSFARVSTEHSYL